MVPYYRELENPNKFPIYLKNNDYDFEKYDYVYDARLPNNYYKRYGELLKESKILPFLARITCFDRFPLISYDEWFNLGTLISYIEDRVPTDFLLGKDPIITTVSEERNLLSLYRYLAGEFKAFYPEYEDKLSFIEKRASELITELDRNSKIKLEPNKYLEINWENAWFITPSGALYNSGGDKGHKEGNLVHDFWMLEETARRKKKVPNFSTEYFDKKIDEITKRGFVSESDFRTYSNLWPSFINLENREIEYDRIREEKAREAFQKWEKEQGGYLNLQEVSKFYDDYFGDNQPAPVRSYQKNIITLVLGYFYAKKDYLNSLSVLSKTQKDDLLSKLLGLVDHRLLDLLVRFSGFSIISSCVPKTIVTATRTPYDDFYQYLKKGWDVYLIPPIEYNKEKDRIEDIDIYTSSIWHYLSSEKEGNKDLKVKILDNRGDPH